MSALYTPEARLLANGWQPPAALARAALKREALISALGELAPNRAGMDPIAEALRRADRDAIR